MSERLKEVDLFEPVKDFLLKQGCSNVYGEVANCDVVGLQGAVDIIVELKTSLNFKVLDQALDRLHLGHYIYIAIPRRKSYLPRSAEKMLKQNGIGVLEVEEDKYHEKLYEEKKLIANVSIPAKFNRISVQYQKKKKDFNRIRKYIKPYHKEQSGGLPSGKVVTDYSVTMDNIKFYLKYDKRSKWATVDEILNRCETHYSNPKPSVSSTLRQEWNSDWVETKVENGKRYFKYKT
ncbi:hypothetical protein [Oceanobacillus timonensis]|uniref:hypothetical protein n=1 Tax=Oceanobacillus timonensis TaxID=1926285 RepID=UPI0009BB5552|nr:hypothetical protein [Oceanobacillus timonensis]